MYNAVECVGNGDLFHFHENPSTKCPVGKNIHYILDDKLLKVQNAMEKELSSITLEDLKHDTDKYLENEKYIKTRCNPVYYVKSIIYRFLSALRQSETQQCSIFII